jgi:large subunit ribosomal protein L22
VAVAAPERETIRARARYVRTSARKARLVLEHIRGKSAVEAQSILRFQTRAVAVDARKVLTSAIANAESNAGHDPEDLVVVAAYADEGPTLKRWRPRARGRVNRIRKRTCHITIELAAIEPAEGTRRARPERAAQPRRRPAPGTEPEPQVEAAAAEEAVEAEAEAPEAAAPAQAEEAAEAEAEAPAKPKRATRRRTAKAVDEAVAEATDEAAADPPDEAAKPARRRRATPRKKPEPEASAEQDENASADGGDAGEEETS